MLPLYPTTVGCAASPRRRPGCSQGARCRSGSGAVASRWRTIDSPPPGSSTGHLWPASGATFFKPVDSPGIHEVVKTCCRSTQEGHGFRHTVHEAIAIALDENLAAPCRIGAISRRPRCLRCTSLRANQPAGYQVRQSNAGCQLSASFKRPQWLFWCFASVSVGCATSIGWA